MEDISSKCNTSTVIVNGEYIPVTKKRKNRKKKRNINRLKAFDAKISGEVIVLDEEVEVGALNTQQSWHSYGALGVDTLKEEFIKDVDINGDFIMKDLCVSKDFPGDIQIIDPITPKIAFEEFRHVMSSPYTPNGITSIPYTQSGAMSIPYAPISSTSIPSASSGATSSLVISNPEQTVRVNAPSSSDIQVNSQRTNDQVLKRNYISGAARRRFKKARTLDKSAVPDRVKEALHKLKENVTQNILHGKQTLTRMAVIADDYPKTLLDENIAWDLKQSFWMKLKEEPILTLEYKGLTSGIVSVECSDDAIQWLKVYDGQTFSNVKLRVVRYMDLPRSVKMIWKRIRVSEDVLLTEELQVLQNLHRFINVDRWIVIETTMEGLEAFSVILMDLESAGVISKSGFSLHAGLHRSYFKMIESATR